MRCLSVAVVFLVALGCGRHALTREQYLAQSNALANEWKAYQIELNSKPLPSRGGLSKSEYLKAIADDIRNSARQDDQFAERMAALNPPPGMADHKQAFQSLMSGLGPRIRLWADAIQSGNRQRQNQTEADLDSFLLSSMDSLIAVTEKHGEDAAQLRKDRADLAAELGASN